MSHTVPIAFTANGNLRRMVRRALALIAITGQLHLSVAVIVDADRPSAPPSGEVARGLGTAPSPDSGSAPLEHDHSNCTICRVLGSAGLLEVRPAPLVAAFGVLVHAVRPDTAPRRDGRPSPSLPRAPPFLPA